MKTKIEKWIPQAPAARGLYDPRFEHDACGCGETTGDAHRGQSLIVWAISEEREAAHCVDVYLMGTSDLPAKGLGDLPRI